MNLTSAARVASRYLEAGLIKPPPAMVEDIFQWASACVALTVLKRGEGQYIQDKEEWVRIAERGRAFDPKPIDRYTVSRSFDVDLTGWPYDAEKFRRVLERKTYWRTINVSINPMAKASQWREELGTITLAIIHPTDDYIRSGMLDALHDTVYHELQHMTQSFMSLAVFDKKLERNSIHRTQPGLPRPDDRTPQFIQGWRGSRPHLSPAGKERQNTLHHLDDVEFHTDLRGEISMYLRSLQRAKLTPERRQAFFNAYTHRPGAAWASWMPLQPSEFLVNLKEHAPRKYVEAMREFAAAVL